MVNRINALVITLEKNVREDDIQDTITAIKCIKNVLGVEINISAPMQEHVTKERFKAELGEKFWNLLKQL